jgi:hypothetical protein
MDRMFGFVGATLGGAVGWWLGDFVGLVTAVMLSMVGTGAGLYAGRRMAARLFE